jgi:hypothetical protein
MRYAIALGLALTLAFGQVAFAGTGWGTADNGNGYYHESNGASTGWGDASNGYGYYHESNGKAVPHQPDPSIKPAQGSSQRFNGSLGG